MGILIILELLLLLGELVYHSQINLIHMVMIIYLSIGGYRIYKGMMSSSKLSLFNQES